MTHGTKNKAGFYQPLKRLTEQDVQGWNPGWSSEKGWKEFEAWIDAYEAEEAAPPNSRVISIDVPDNRPPKADGKGSMRIFKYVREMAALLILGLGALNAHAVLQLCKEIVVPTWEEMKAKRDKEAYLKTRPWYERASNRWSERSPRHTKGISKALGADDNAIWDMKRQMDSLGFDNTVDYYKWLKTQKKKR